MKLEKSKEPAHVKRAPEVTAARPTQLKVQLRSLGFSDAEARLAPDAQTEGGAGGSGGVHRAAAEGIKSGGSSLPHLEAVQESFGHHDVSGVQAHVGGKATDASAVMGASAYATGNDVAFAESPNLHTTAHEAAHVVQQRAGVSLSGGVGQAGDTYEQHADQVADAVVAGKSAEPILDRMAGGGGGGLQAKSVQKEQAGRQDASTTESATTPVDSGKGYNDLAKEVFQRNLEKRIDDELVNARLAIQNADLEEPMIRHHLKWAEKSLPRLTEVCAQAVERGRLWWKAEGDKALDTFSQGAGDFLKSMGENVALVLAFPESTVLGLIAEASLAYRDVAGQNSDVAAAHETLEKAGAALQEADHVWITNFGAQMQSAALGIGKLISAADALFGTSGVPSAKHSLEVSAKQVRERRSKGAESTPTDLQVVLAATDQAKRLGKACRALEQDARSADRDTTAAVVTARKQANAAYDDMVARYIKEQALQAEHGGGWHADPGFGIQLSGTCIEKGGDFEIRLPHGRGLDATRETYRRFDEMTWQDFRNHGIPIDATMTLEGRTPAGWAPKPSMTLAQGADGKRSDNAPEGIDADRIWAILERSTRGSLK